MRWHTSHSTEATDLDTKGTIVSIDGGAHRQKQCWRRSWRWIKIADPTILLHIGLVLGWVIHRKENASLQALQQLGRRPMLRGLASKETCSRKWPEIDVWYSAPTSQKNKHVPAPATSLRAQHRTDSRNKILQGSWTTQDRIPTIGLLACVSDFLVTVASVFPSPFLFFV